MTCGQVPPERMTTDQTLRAVAVATSYPQIFIDGKGAQLFARFSIPQISRFEAAGQHRFAVLIAHPGNGWNIFDEQPVPLFTLPQLLLNCPSAIYLFSQGLRTFSHLALKSVVGQLELKAASLT